MFKKLFLFALIFLISGCSSNMKTEDFIKNLREARDNSSPAKILDMIPYGNFIGSKARLDEEKLIFGFEKCRNEIKKFCQEFSLEYF